MRFSCLEKTQAVVRPFSLPLQPALRYLLNSSRMVLFNTWSNDYYFYYYGHWCYLEWLLVWSAMVDKYGRNLWSIKRGIPSKRRRRQRLFSVLTSGFCSLWYAKGGCWSGPAQLLTNVCCFTVRARTNFVTFHQSARKQPVWKNGEKADTFILSSVHVSRSLFYFCCSLSRLVKFIWTVNESTICIADGSIFAEAGE